MLIKGALAQKIIQRTGLGHNPGHIREKIRHANIAPHERHKIIEGYDRLLHGKPMPKQEVKTLLQALGDKKVVNLHDTYLHTIAHNPEKVMSWAKNIVKSEEHERRQEQMRVEEEQLKKVELEKKKKPEEEKKEADALSVAPVSALHGKTPLPRQIKAG